MSMNPGASVLPAASTVSAAGASGGITPTSAMWPPFTATSAAKARPPVPSSTRALRINRSNIAVPLPMAFSYGFLRRIDPEHGRHGHAVGDGLEGDRRGAADGPGHDRDIRGRRAGRDGNWR